MKTMKKVMALLLAAVMLLALGTTALASYHYTAVAADATYDSETQYFTDTNGTAYTGGAEGFEAAITAGLYTRADTITMTVDASNPDTNDVNNKSEKYTAYKIFDVVKALDADGNNNDDTLGSGNELGYNYTISTTSPWYDTISSLTDSNGDKYFTLKNIAGDPSKKTVSLRDNKYNTAKYAEEIAGKLKAAMDSLTLDENTDYWVIYDATKNQVDAKVVPAGYYLITSTLGSNLVLATTDINITEKNTYPSIDKTQTDKTDNGVGVYYKDEDVNVQIGDTIYYQIVVYVPATADKDIMVKDTMTAGLTYNTVTSATANTGYDSTSKELFGSAALLAPDLLASDVDQDYYVNHYEQEVTFTIHPTDNTKGKFVCFRYQATVNENVLLNDLIGRNNMVTLTYSNYTQRDMVTFTTYATGAVKYDGATATKNDNDLLTATGGGSITYLSATFKLQRDGVDVQVVKVGSGETAYYRPAVSGEDGVGIVSDASNQGQIIIRGLDLGDETSYRLVETAAPAGGYNLLEEPVSLKVTKEDKLTNVDLDATADVVDDTTSDTTVTGLSAAQVVKIANQKGSLLPSTGGIGTTIFYVIGGILVLAAVVVLVSRRRMSAEK